jgi:polyisoprenoid-binding protein YceI
MASGYFRSLRFDASTLVGAMLGLALLVPAGSAQAQAQKVDVDLEHAAVTWTISHGGFTSVMGQFRQINKAEMTFDRKDPSNSKVSVEIEAASIDSNHAYRDNWIRSEAELDVWKHRTITFESTKIEKTGENTGKMTGNLTMHGVTHPVTMDVAYNKSGLHLSKKYTIDGFTAKGKLKRTDYGMKAFIPWIGEEVEFVIQFETKRPNDPT